MSERVQPSYRPCMVVPFYGAENRELFTIEREAMDRHGKVLGALDAILPSDGVVLDIGAGNGSTSEGLSTKLRSVVAIEPAAGMIDSLRPVHWVQGVAQSLPFHDGAFDGAYATWAYFFPAFHDVTPGLDEVDRVTKADAPIVIVDNAGDDEFTAMASHDIAIDVAFWRDIGFTVEIIQTAFVFDSLHDADELLTFYFGERAKPALEIEYRVAVMVRN